MIGGAVVVVGITVVKICVVVNVVVLTTESVRVISETVTNVVVDMRVTNDVIS